MDCFEVLLRDGSVEQVRGADAYQPEGQLTSFFTLGADRTSVDSWSTRVASVRTAEIMVVRRVEAAASAQTRHLHAAASGAQGT